MLSLQLLPVFHVFVLFQCLHTQKMAQNTLEKNQKEQTPQYRQGINEGILNMHIDLRGLCLIEKNLGESLINWYCKHRVQQKTQAVWMLVK